MAGMFGGAGKTAQGTATGPSTGCSSRTRFTATSLANLDQLSLTWDGQHLGDEGSLADD